MTAVKPHTTSKDTSKENDPLMDVLSEGNIHIVNNAACLRRCLNALLCAPKTDIAKSIHGTTHILILIEEAATLTAESLPDALSQQSPQGALTVFRVPQTAPEPLAHADHIQNLTWPQFVTLSLSCSSCTTW